MTINYIVVSFKCFIRELPLLKKSGTFPAKEEVCYRLRYDLKKAKLFKIQELRLLLCRNNEE